MGKPLLWGLASGLVYFVEPGSFLGLASGPVSLFFKPYQDKNLVKEKEYNTL